jgi:periplasmic protein TorT
MQLRLWVWVLLAGVAAAVAPEVKAQGAASAPGGATASEPAEAAADVWYPASVERRRPPFYPGGTYTRLDYMPLAGAAEAWELCAVLPPQNFEYFRALAGGLAAEAARQAVSLELTAVDEFDAEAQLELLESCLEGEPDALLVAAVAEDAFGAPLSRARARGLPVIGMVTGSGDDNVTAHIVTDRADVGRAAGRFLAERYPPGGETAEVVWLYGPRGSAVARDIDRGFRAGIAAGAIEIVHAEAIGLSDREIRRAIREAVDEVESFDALVGGAKTIQIAAEELAAEFSAGAVELVSLTLTSSMLAGLEADRVFAAVNDKVATQGRIAVDLAVRAIEQRPHLIDLRPNLQIVDRSNVSSFDRGSVLPPE